MRAKTMRYGTLAAALVLAAWLPALAQAGEGYDPMLQITHQFAHPNILIVQDVSGSMAWNLDGNDVGQDTNGLPSWTYVRQRTGTGCSNTRQYNYHKYTLNLKKPSRLCILKNALGDSVSLYTTQIPATWPTFTGWTYRGLDGSGNPYWDKTIACTSTAQTAPFTAPTEATA